MSGTHVHGIAGLMYPVKHGTSRVKCLAQECKGAAELKWILWDLNSEPWAPKTGALTTQPQLFYLWSFCSRTRQTISCIVCVDFLILNHFTHLGSLCGINTPITICAVCSNYSEPFVRYNNFPSSITVEWWLDCSHSVAKGDLASPF